MISLLPMMTSLALGTGTSQNQPQCQIRAPLVFTPSSLTFKDSDGGQTFSVSLANAPAGPVTYNLNGQNLKFDKCSVQFDGTNWNKPQIIRTIPTIYKGNALTLKFNITATGVNGKKTKGIVPVTRYAMDAPVALSAGDPHFTFFNGLVLSQQKHIVNYLFKSPDFEVLAAQGKCTASSGVYCNQAVVVRFGDSWYTYDSRNAAKDGSGIVVSFNGVQTNGFVYSGPISGNGGKGTYDFTIPDGSTVSVFPSAFSAQYGIHNTIKITLHPSMALKGSGALNTPYVQKATLVNGDGSVGNSGVSADGLKFFNSWAVPDSRNFLMGIAPASAKSDMPIYMVCNSTTAVATPKVFSKYSNTWKKVVQTEASLKIYSTAEKAAAKATCASVFQGLDFCQDIVSSKGTEEVCYQDMLLSMNNVVLAQDHLEDYLLQCADNINSLAEIDAQIDGVMAKFGFGSIACPNNCSGNGECTTSGCTCNTGFHLSDCSVAN